MATALRYTRRPPISYSQENKAAVLRVLLDAYGMTQTQLAETTGIAQSNISAYVTGTRPIPDKRLDKLAGAFKVPGETFITTASYVEGVFAPAVKDIVDFRDKRLEKARANLLVTSNRKPNYRDNSLKSKPPMSVNHPAVRAARRATVSAA
jgi:transcriptional regulator with XRE-family HTH domain